MRIIEGAKHRFAKHIIRRKYGYGHLWTFNTAMEAWGSEDFNENEILKLHEGDFVDAGAAYGFWTIRASKYYKRIVALEPDPRIRSELARNMHLNHVSNATVLPYALSDTNCQQLFYLYSLGESSLLYNHMGKTGSSALRIFVCSLDKLVETLKIEPSVVKLDIEGGEAKALAGAGKTIAEFHPTLIVEVHHPVIGDDITSQYPSYKWETRYRYLNQSAYPFERQLHLLGKASVEK